MDEKRLFEVCFSLAENMMWERTTSPIEKLPEQMGELSAMTENFVNLSKKNFYLVEDLRDGQEILIGAIQYLNALAIPPLRGNYEWFEYSLAILLELANPSGGPDQSSLPFLLRVRNGIEQLIDWANYPEDE